MTHQFTLPIMGHTWLHSGRDAREELARIEGDTLELKAALRDLLERTADRHGIGAGEISAVIAGYADDMLSDLFYETKSRLEREIEDSTPA